MLGDLLERLILGCVNNPILENDGKQNVIIWFFSPLAAGGQTDQSVGKGTGISQPQDIKTTATVMFPSNSDQPRSCFQAILTL